MPEHVSPERSASGRPRFREALTSANRSQLVVAVLLATLGFGAVTQVRSTNVDDTYAGARQQDLIDIFSGLTGSTQRAEAEIQRLEATREELLDKSSRRQAAVEQAESEADTLSILAGLVPVRGPGIRVTITEESGRIFVSTMLDVIQEVRVADAEAIAINGEVRVVASTSFELAEEGFEIDGKQVASPYTIEIIGPPEALRGAIEFSGGPRTQVEDEDRGSLDLQTVEKLDIDVTVPTGENDFATFDGDDPAA